MQQGACSGILSGTTLAGAAPGGGNGGPVAEWQGWHIHPGRTPDVTEILAFVQRWGLNEDAEDKLRRICPEAQAVVMDEFNAPSRMSDHQKNGMFISFCNSVNLKWSNGFKGGKKGGTAPPRPQGEVD